MPTRKRTLRKCAIGHEYLKSTDCPTCPRCEEERAPASGFLAGLSAPARRALEREKISTLAQLSKKSEREILALHGMGPGSIPKLRAALESKGLSFRK
ncbi:MAG: RNA polymerase alpha subunit C-terminal domain-containing protein [Gemmatimonadota bacterium]|nr:RNA polymerase alpha subunit C-terminal domain-containing protein [Gemmatimonadota bacterium]